MKPHDIERIQAAYPCFAGIPDSAWQEADILAISPSTPHAIREGHIFQHAMFIVSGWIRVYQISPTGREITLYRVYSGQSCVLMMASILGDIPYEACVSVEEETEVLLLSVTMFHNWMGAYPSVRQFIYRQFTERMTTVTTLLDKVAFQSIPYRLAEYLLVESNRQQTPALRMTHEQLAVEIGTAREVITRILKSFAAQGTLALSRGQITILNRAQLQHSLDHPL
ncbi:Crp/Fnr family transcriptional regulator [Paenibacillus sp. SI8]|uniref:Crp/Fnr family transcriptional regulator n=1 Tax=unclassified Paenibacillus TaxID=185978 RepID=UPI0034657CB4